jgi:hypothetical protein
MGSRDGLCLRPHSRYPHIGFFSLEPGSPASAARSWWRHCSHKTELWVAPVCLGHMTDIDRELREEREAKDLEYRWRRGSIEMLIIFLVLLGFWAGINLLTQ